jgi:hypothetical protein
MLRADERTRTADLISSYELDLDHSNQAEKSLTYSEKESQRIAVLCPITPRLVYRLV